MPFKTRVRISEKNIFHTIDDKMISTSKKARKRRKLVICLIHMPPFGIHMPPLGIPLLAAKLKADGHEVFAFDFNLDYYYSYLEKRQFLDYNKSFFWADKKKFLSNNLLDKETIEKWAKAVLEKKPDIIGLTVTDHSFLGANALSDRIKKECSNVLIVYGGPFCSRQLLEFRETTDSVDAYVFGEGEITFSEIASSVKKTGRIKPAKGILFKKNGNITDCGLREPCDIDSLPMPDFSILPLEKYSHRDVLPILEKIVLSGLSHLHLYSHRDVLPILMSRGCNFCCTFCSDYVNWGHYRMRSPENILTEIERNIALYGVYEFHCNDLMFNGDLAKLEALADEIIKKGLDIRLFGQGRIRNDMKPELFRKLRKAGFYRITVGIESASQHVLDSMKKGFRIREAENFLAGAKKAGISVMTMWIVGFPTERWHDFFKTIWFIIKNRKNIDSISALTRCNLHLEAELFIKRDKYGIKFDKDGNWYNRNVNIKTRERREKMFRAIVPLFVPFRENQ